MHNPSGHFFLARVVHAVESSQTLKKVDKSRQVNTSCIAFWNRLQRFISTLNYQSENFKTYVVPYSGPVPYNGPRPYKRSKKDRYRGVDRYSGRSYRSKRLEFRFAVAVHSPIAVHGPIAVQPEFFKFPRRNVPLGISLSTDFSAFSSFRRETCESTSLSALIFVPFQEQKKVWRGLPGIFVRCVVLFLSCFCLIPCVVFSKGEERRFCEGLLGLKKVTLTERQTCFLNVNFLLSGVGVWAG